MLGYLIACVFWNIYWIIEDIHKQRRYFRRFDFTVDIWCSIGFWIFNLVGIISLVQVIMQFN